MINTIHFGQLVIRPALEAIGLYSPEAEQLLLGTALQESRLTYLKQLGTGPALGLFQMEPATHKDIWTNYLRYEPKLSQKVAQLAHFVAAESMATDLLYAAAMCRIHYRRVSAPLPAFGDVYGQACYWKEYYNTYQGAGTAREYMEAWERTHGS